MQSLEQMLAMFDGSDIQMAALRRAMLRELRAVPSDHPVREKADGFLTDLAVLAFGLTLDDGDLAGVRRFIAGRWSALSAEVQAAVRASLH